MSDISAPMSEQDALVTLMIAVSASDETIKTVELMKIERIVTYLPIFKSYDLDRLKQAYQTVFELFEEEEGIDALFGLIRSVLPKHLHETAYALACDVAASDGRLDEIELRFLEEIRYELNIDSLKYSILIGIDIHFPFNFKI